MSWRYSLWGIPVTVDEHLDVAQRNEDPVTIRVENVVYPDMDGTVGSFAQGPDTYISTVIMEINCPDPPRPYRRSHRTRGTLGSGQRQVAEQSERHVEHIRTLADALDVQVRMAS